MLLVGHRQYKLRQVATPACIYCRSCSDATLPHALLQCSAFSEQQAAFWRSITAVLGEATVAQLKELPVGHQLLCILGDAEWAPLAVGVDVVDAVVQRYLLDLQAAQAQYAVVAGGIGRTDQACQVCMRRDGPTMLLCDGCNSGYHMKCLVPRVYRVPAGDWLCSGCCD
jgi:hypothetical protein